MSLLGLILFMVGESVFSQKLDTSNPLLEIMNVVGNINPSSNPNEYVSPKDVTYYLYTNRDTRNAYKLQAGSDFPDSINREAPFKFIIHGYTESYDKPHYQAMVKEYSKRGDYNIFLVDWSRPANQTISASINAVQKVGGIVGDYLTDVSAQLEVPYDRMHVIGHSLGAQIAGFVGKHIRATEGALLGRISALDPAGPGFRTKRENEKLHKGDAKFVDVMHTDSNLFGHNGRIGTTDFFPNGGAGIQPGCGFPNLLQILKGDQESLFCSHHRSYEFFTESINSKQFRATRCASWDKYLKGGCKHERQTTYGEDLDTSDSGSFYFKTNPQSPFARG